MSTQEKIEILKIAAQIYASTTKPGRVNDQDQLKWFSRCVEAVYGQFEEMRAKEEGGGRGAQMV